MSATEYDVNLRDIYFILFEQLGMADVLGIDKYKDYEVDDLKMILDEAAKFAKGVVAPHNSIADEKGCHWEDGNVTTPEGMKAIYQQYAESGWIGMAGAQEYGGQGMPKMVSMAASDIFTGAHTAFALYHMLTVGAGHILEAWCDEATKQKYLPNMYSGKWSGTMVLTEPQAGSDLGAVKATAKPVDGEDYYLVEGSKLFITAGDHDMSENIIHMVLARTPGAPAGTKGISLFLVPKYRVNDDGSNGDHNDVHCVRIEHKHGINGSATSQMSFGDNGECRGWLIGEENIGMKIMFLMMNEARIEVGVQGMTGAASSYMYAREYAKERTQGSRITDRAKDAAKVPIIEHADVRRMLLHIRAYAEGMRAMLYASAKNADLAHNATDEKERERNQFALELLTPICKAYGSDFGLEAAGMAVSVYGGVGYTKEYPVEQVVRDTRIATIYEGTNGIQALDLLGRKLMMKGGALFQSYMKELMTFCAKTKEHERLGQYATQLEDIAGALTGTVMQLGAAAMGGNLEGAATWSQPFLHAFGDVVLGYQHLQQAVVADGVLQKRYTDAGVDGSDKAAVKAHWEDSEESKFYATKLGNLQYWYGWVLPQTKTKLDLVSKCDTMAIDTVF